MSSHPKETEKGEVVLCERLPEKGGRELGNAIQLAEGSLEAKYNPWTKSLSRLYGCLIIAYLCGCLNGYDGSLMGGLNDMTSYLNYFHM